MSLEETSGLNSYRDRVSSYYDVITEPYRRLWGDYFHPAIFQDPDDDIETALAKTHELFMRDSGLQSGDVAVDLGCGIGSLACLISETVGCRVVGINICNFQLKRARKFAKSKGIDNVDFRNLEIMDVGTLEERFDAAFLIDVGCHLPDKARALGSVYEVLNKGGRLVIADWLQKESVSAFEKELLIDPLNEYWHFPYMASLQSYRKLLKKIGYRIIKADDVSEETRKNWDAFYEIALEEVGKMTIKRLISYVKNPSILRKGKEAVQIAKNQFYANVFTKVCFDAGVFRYGYIVAEA